MADDEELKILVKNIIRIHDEQNFNQLLPLVSENEIKAARWFSENRFKEVCEAIKNEIGTNTSIEYIGKLTRKSSMLTLWKTKYTMCDDEILWQIIFNTKDNKIRLLHINWEQIN